MLHFYNLLSPFPYISVILFVARMDKEKGEIHGFELLLLPRQKLAALVPHVSRDCRFTTWSIWTIHPDCIRYWKPDFDGSCFLFSMF